MGPFQLQPAEVMFAMGVAMLTALLLRRWLRYQRKQKHSGLPPRPRVESHSRLLDAPSDVTRWQVEMHDYARELSGELDSKMAGLQVLVRMAREESLRLETQLEELRRLRAEVKGEALQQIAEMESIDNVDLPPSSPPLDARIRQEIYQLSDAGLSPAAIAAEVHCSTGDVELYLSLR